MSVKLRIHKSMKPLKDYLQDSPRLTDIKEYIKNALKKGVKSVYNEATRPNDAVRVWVSFDFNKTQGKDYYTYVDKWSEELKAETWGNSVRTFLLDQKGKEPTIESIAKQLVTGLIKYGILEGKTFEDGNWKNTKDVSIYVIYRYKVDTAKNSEKSNIKRNSDHFVLVMNADIPHDDAFEKSKEKGFDFNE